MEDVIQTAPKSSLAPSYKHAKQAFGKTEALEGELWVYVDRVARGDRNHCHPRCDAAACTLEG